MNGEPEEREREPLNVVRRLPRKAAFAFAVAFVTVVIVMLALGWLALPRLIAQRTLGLMIGVACDPVSIEITPDLSHASIARTVCTIPAGPIASFTLSDGAEVALTDLRPRRIEVPTLAVSPRLLETAAALSALLLTGDTPDPVRRTLTALAAAAARTDLPERVAIGEIDAGRGDALVVARRVVVTHGDGAFDVTLASIGPPAYHSRFLDWALAVNEMGVHATPSTAILTGRFDVDANIASFPIARSIAFRLTGNALDSADADYDLWIEPSQELTWLRARGQALLDEIRAAGGVTP